jgi:putative endonuclease
MAGNTARTLARKRGREAEQQALKFLRANGLVAVAKNFRCRFGEVDHIMCAGNCLVFVEVRYRASSRFVSAACSVDRHKQKKLVRTAASFLSQHAEYRNHNVRFDVLAFDKAPEQECELQWIKDAFRP